MVNMQIPEIGWKEDAACAGINDDTFFPQSNSLEDAAGALEICRRCPVVQECGEYALNLNIREGIWGGMITYQRTIILRQRAIHHRMISELDIIHGTSAGAMWERRHLGQVCDACLRAERERTIERRMQREGISYEKARAS